MAKGFGSVVLRWFVALALAAAVVPAWAQGPEEIQKAVVDAADLYKAGKLEEAVQAFEKLRERAPDNVDVQAWLGFLYLRSNRAKDAVPLLEQANKARPNDLEVANNLGAAYTESGNLEAAEKVYAKIVAASPSLLDPWYNLGNVRLKRKDPKGAVEAFSKAAAIRPNDPYVHNNLGVAYEALGDNLKSAEAFVKAANLSPTTAVFLKNAGFALIRAQQTQAAVPFLEQALKLEPKNGDLRIALADAYTRLNRRKEALAIYESLQEQLADRPAFWFNLGVLRAQSNNLDGATVAYERALELNPNDLDALNNLGLLHYRRGQYDQARTIFQKLVGLNPSSTQAKLNLAAACLKLGDRKEAAAQWREVLKANPKQWLIRLNLANVLWQDGDADGAKAQYELVLKENPKSADAWNGIGLYHLGRSQLEPARQAFASALAANPKFSPAAINLAIVYERLNRKADAIRTLQQALKNDPSNPEIQKNLKRLRESG